MNAKDLEQAEFFRNRLLKNEKRLRKWARREAVFAFRLYDKDIPEVPLAVDIYRETKPIGADGRPGGESEDCLLIALYERPYEKDPALEDEWLALMAETAASALGVARERVFHRTRRRQRGSSQYERGEGEVGDRVVIEGGLSFILNFGDYLDTGLFLDHRPTRARVREESRDRRVLNLFAYTGSFTVYAAAGGASETTSVDLSNTYLAWARRNLALNGLDGVRHSFVKSDVRAFLERARAQKRGWDLIVCDPPTFSNSSATDSDFDVNRDWPALIGLTLGVLSPGGSLYFSTNSRRLRWDPSLIAAAAEDISEASLPPDFRDRRIRRSWRIAGAG